MTSLIPDIEAPKQRPVDMAPHPEYKSNKLHSDFSDPLFWLDSPLTTLLSATHALVADSHESVDVSLSILTFSISIKANHNQIKQFNKVTMQKHQTNHHK